MRKIDEKIDKNSCWNKASLQEFLFIVMGRDLAMPHTIREWSKKRIELKLNKPEDRQIVEALELAKLLDDANSDVRY